jgi:3-polyprenyl-4-hydroxybenzoate decarboxylase
MKRLKVGISGASAAIYGRAPISLFAQTNWDRGYVRLIVLAYTIMLSKPFGT